jgi:hypothetical protein
MRVLNEQQIEEFLREGVLVVDDILNPTEVDQAKRGLVETLTENGVNANDLLVFGTGRALQNLSSTNGSGGVLDVFYPQWKLCVATNPLLFHATCQLWEAAYCHKNESIDSLDQTDRFKWHPYGTFETTQGFMYIDRIGYRIPTCTAEKLGAEMIQGDVGRTKRKVMPLQRSLTPHLDCCPSNLYSDKTKWRPIQCFVSLTDNLIRNTGGFEAAPGFHRDFENWTKTRQPTVFSKKINGSVKHTTLPAPCLGEYTHIRPKEDSDVLARIRHIPARAGSAVFWDNRIPHANSYRNDDRQARAVVYCSFLPNVAINREYVHQQLLNFQRGKKPTDQWINVGDDDGELTTDVNEHNGSNETPTFSPLGRKLMGIDDW